MSDAVKPSEVRVAIMRAALSPAAKFAAIRIFDVQGRRDGVCKLSAQRLANDCGLSQGGVHRALRELTAEGWLATERPSPNKAHRFIKCPTLETGETDTLTASHPGETDRVTLARRTGYPGETDRPTLSVSPPLIERGSESDLERGSPPAASSSTWAAERGLAPSPPSNAAESLIADTRKALRRSWSDAWAGRFAVSATSQQLDDVAKLTTWCIEYAKRGDDDGPGVARRLIAAFFEAKTKHRPRVEWLAEDPGRYLEPSERPEAVTAAKRAEARRLDAERAERERLHAATVAREQAEGSVPGVGFDFNALLSGASARRRVDTETHEDRSRARQQSAEERARLIAAQRERLIASLEAAE